MSRDEFRYNWQRWPSKGRGMCRVCGVEHGDKRCMVCGECRPIYEAVPFSWGDVRHKVKRRDKGVCSGCGLDTPLFYKWWRRISRHLPYYPFGVRTAIYKVVGFRSHTHDQWDAHHANPVEHHGAAESLDDIVTLCVECHKKAHAAKSTDAPKAQPPQTDLFGDTT